MPPELRIAFDVPVPTVTLAACYARPRGRMSVLASGDTRPRHPNGRKPG